MTCPLLARLLAWAAFVLPPGDAPPPKVPPVNPVAKFAGRYVQGGGFGHRVLRIRAEGRFEYESGGCLGAEELHRGSAEVVNGRLVLRPRMFNLPRTGLCLLTLGGICLFGDEKLEDLRRTASDFLFWDQPTEFIPVRWGARTYLVPRDEGPSFCDGVNLGWERNIPGLNFYCRDDARGLKVEGLPKVPKDWEPMLRNRPLRGELIGVLSPFMARVDFGSASGAWKGMSLQIEGKGSGAVQGGVGGRNDLRDRAGLPLRRAFRGGPDRPHASP